MKRIFRKGVYLFIFYNTENPTHLFYHFIIYFLLQKRKQGSEKFVNAILRRIEREGVADFESIKRKNKRYSIQY